MATAYTAGIIYVKGECASFGATRADKNGQVVTERSACVALLPTFCIPRVSFYQQVCNTARVFGGNLSDPFRDERDDLKEPAIWIDELVIICYDDGDECFNGIMALLPPELKSLVFRRPWVGLPPDNIVDAMFRWHREKYIYGPHRLDITKE